MHERAGHKRRWPAPRLSEWPMLSFLDFAENDFYAAMQAALVTRRSPALNIAFARGFIDERECRGHHSPDFVSGGRFRGQGVPHGADLVTQARLCKTIKIRAPFGLPDTLQGTVGIRHLWF